MSRDGSDSSPSPAGLIAALETEATAILGRGRIHVEDGLKIRRGTRDGVPYLCVVSGVGPGRAYHAAKKLAALGVDRILSMGVSGGLEPALRAGTVVVGTVVREHVPGQVPETVWEGSRENAESVVRLLEKARLSATPGRLVTVPAPALTLDAKRFLRTDHDALAVDMESSAVARAAMEMGLPYLAVRAICDDAEREVPPEVVRAVSESGETGLGRVLAMILKKPSLLPRLLAMGREYNKALKALGRAFDALAGAGFPCGPS